MTTYAIGLIGLEATLLFTALASALHLWRRPYTFRARDASVSAAAGAWRWFRTKPGAVSVAGSLVVRDGDLCLKDGTGVMLLALWPHEVSKISDELAANIDGRDAVVLGWPRFNALLPAVRPWEVRVGEIRLLTRGWREQVVMLFGGIALGVGGLILMGIAGSTEALFFAGFATLGAAAAVFAQGPA